MAPAIPKFAWNAGCVSYTLAPPPLPLQAVSGPVRAPDASSGRLVPPTPMT